MWLACLTLGVASWAQQSVKVFPLDPPNDGVIPARAVFRLGYRGIEDSDLRRARFRIRLTPQQLGRPAITFDQRRRKRGWSAGEPGVMLFRPPRPVPDGSYEWTVSVWDGVEWQTDDRSFRLRVDSVPPAPVENLRVEYHEDRGLLSLNWDPVSIDLDGGPEYVALYRVYRYSRADSTPKATPFEVTRTEYPTAEIRVSSPEEAQLWFFHVTAEDLAGNEADRNR